MASVVLVVGLVLWVGPAQLLDAIAGAHLGWLAVALALSLVNIVAGGVNIYILSKTLAPELRFEDVLRAYLTSWAYGTITPGRLGDFTLSPLLAKAGVGHGLGLAVVTVDKLVSFAVLAAIGCIGLVANAEGQQALVAAALTTAIVVAAVLVIRFPALRMLVRKWVLRGQESKFEGFSRQVGSFAREHRGALALNTAWTVVRTFLQAALAGAGLLTFGANVDILTIVFVNSITTLSAFIPITISGLGVRQGTAVALYEHFAGTARAPVLNTYLLFQIPQYAYAAIFMFWVRARSDERD